MVVSTPRFLSSVALWPGIDATQLALAGENLRPASYERAQRSLQSATRVQTHPDFLSQLAIIEHNYGRQLNDHALRDLHYASSREAAVDALTTAPVRPVTWLLLAQIAYEQQDTGAAAEALDWALRSSHYMRHQARERAVLALALWDLVAEETRVKSMDAIADTMARDIDLVASVAGVSGAEDDVRQRLLAMEPDGALLWARFGAAMRRYHHNQQLRLAAYEEYSAMVRSLIATSMLITASLPMVAEAMSVHEYLTISRGDHPVREPDSVDEYLTAVVDGLLMLGHFNREDGIALFCVSNREMLDFDIREFRFNLDTLLAQYEREMPNFDTLSRTRSVGLISLETLTVLYPCDG